MAIGNTGVVEDLLIRRGADYEAKGIVRHEDGERYDLTDCVLTAVVNKSWNQPAPSLRLTVSITSAPEGEFKITASASETESLACGETQNDPKSMYLFQMDMLDQNGRTIPLLKGAASVFRRLAS